MTQGAMAIEVGVETVGLTLPPVLEQIDRLVISGFLKESTAERAKEWHLRSTPIVSGLVVPLMSAQGISDNTWKVVFDCKAEDLRDTATIRPCRVAIFNEIALNKGKSWATLANDRKDGLPLSAAIVLSTYIPRTYIIAGGTQRGLKYRPIVVCDNVPRVRCCVEADFQAENTLTPTHNGLIGVI